MDDFTLEERLPDGNDFGVDGGFFLEDGFGPGDGGLEDFVDMPTVSDITLEPNKTPEREEEEKKQGESVCVLNEITVTKKINIDMQMSERRKRQWKLMFLLHLVKTVCQVGR